MKGLLTLSTGLFMPGYFFVRAVLFIKTVYLLLLFLEKRKLVCVTFF